MKCVLCINIGRPEAKEYEYITYWLISSRIANCFELTATLSYLYNRLWKKTTCINCIAFVITTTNMRMKIWEKENVANSPDHKLSQLKLL